MLIYLTREQIAQTPLSEEERQLAEHYSRVLERREMLPMVHPTEKNELGLPCVVPTIIPTKTTNIIETLLEIFRSIERRLAEVNSNWCRCADRYKLLEEGKEDWIKRWVAGEIDPKTQQPITRDTLNQKLLDIDNQIKQMFPNKIPSQWAETIHDPVCEYCGKPRMIDQTMAYSEPGLIRNVLNVFLGGEFPLSAWRLFVEYLDRLIFSDELIPAAKKKQVAALDKKLHITELRNLFLGWIGQKLLAIQEEETSMHQRRMKILQTPAEDKDSETTALRQDLKAIIEQLQGTISPSVPNTSPGSTNTTVAPGDGQKMLLTPDFHPTSETSTTSKALNNGENSPMK